MIGYVISKSELEPLIEAEASGWLQKAKDRTETFRTQGFYEESSSIWSEVKAVYMRLQGEGKCAYCERKLESVELGKVEQDVEHFRPKSNVRVWKMSKSLVDAGVVQTKPADDGGGYYLLPYNIFNYAAACKPCNSVLKKDYFPIAGNYDPKGEDPRKLKKEKPFLLYPIGDFDDQPETVIKFHGVSPQPAAASGHKRHRALVTIEFFKLDDSSKRKNLYRERAMVIVVLHPQLKKAATGGNSAEAVQARQIVEGFTSSKSAHANCARSFKRLFETDPAEAQAVFDRAVELIRSIS
jgi:hypothetical protein